MAKAIDLTGQTIDKLTILKRKREKNRTYYYCKCDCSNELWIRADILRKMKCKSCGCVNKEISKNKIKRAIKQHLENNIVEGTNIAVISSKIVKTNNKSGHTGVSWDKDRNKWISVITFKKKTYNLGRYENKEDAIKVRKEAEQKIFGEFLEWYNNLITNKLQ